MPPVPCVDPQTKAFLYAASCAIREARPVVTLPPQNFIPFHAQPWFVENRVILNGSLDPLVDVGAVEAASADGLGTPISEVGGFATIILFNVPRGYMGFLKKWGADSDEGGYFLNNALTPPTPFVQHSLTISDGKTIISPALRGVHGTTEMPFQDEIMYLVPEDHQIEIRSMSTDPSMWHLIEAFMLGYIVETNKISEMLGDLLNACK